MAAAEPPGDPWRNAPPLFRPTPTPNFLGTDTGRRVVMRRRRGGYTLAMPHYRPYRILGGCYFFTVNLLEMDSRLLVERISKRKQNERTPIYY